MLHTTLQLAAFFAAAAGAGVAALSYSRLPDRVPIHFGWTGRADGWARREAIWMLPILGLVLFVVLAVASRGAPSPTHTVLALANLETQALFLSIVRSQVAVARGLRRRLLPEFWVIFALAMLTLPLYVMISGPTGHR